MRLIFLIIILPFQIISQNPPIGFIKFWFPIDKEGHPHFFEKGYDLYTSSEFTKQNYYGYLEYKWDGGPQLKLHLKDSFSKSEHMQPYIIEDRANDDQNSYFAISRKRGKKVQFAFNNNKYLWVKTGKKVIYNTTNEFFTKTCICAYADSTISLYSTSDTTSKIKSDARFLCFSIKEIKNNWARVATTYGDPCDNFNQTKLNEAWIIWYNQKLLIRPEPW